MPEDKFINYEIQDGVEGGIPDEKRRKLMIAIAQQGQNPNAQKIIDKALERGWAKPPPGVMGKIGRFAAGEGLSFAREFITPEVVDYPVAAGRFVTQLIRKGVEGGELWNEALEKTQKYFEDIQRKSPASGVVGGLTSFFPAIFASTKLALRGLPKAYYKGIPGRKAALTGKIEELGANVDIPERVLKGAIGGAGKFEKIDPAHSASAVADLANDFVKHVTDYKKFRDAVYSREMGKLVSEAGNKKIPITKFKRLIFDVNKDSELFSPRFRKYLEELQGLLKDKGEISFRQLNRIKQIISKRFGAWGKNYKIGAAKPEDISAARRLQYQAKELINQTVPEAKNINNAYYEASTLLEDLGQQVIGPMTKGGVAKSAPGKMRGLVANPNMENVARIVDDFVKKHPEAEKTWLDFMGFVGSKELPKRIPTIAGTTGTGGGVRATGRGIVETIGTSLPLKGRVGLLKVVDRPFQFGKTSKAGFAQLPFTRSRYRNLSDTITGKTEQE